MNYWLALLFMALATSALVVGMENKAKVVLEGRILSSDRSGSRDSP
jgi:hypothetical protein